MATEPLPCAAQAFFGNGDVLKAVRRLAEKRGSNVAARGFVGRETRGGARDRATRATPFRRYG